MPDDSPRWWRRSAARRLALAGLLALFLGRIALTYPVFNDTFDENIHIRCGLEVLQRRAYTLEAQHPPLGRIVVAILPYYWGGLRLSGSNQLWADGPWAQREEAFYWKTLFLARAGNLIFAALIFLVVYLWAARLSGPWAGLGAGVLLACCPTLLGHASLATLDIGLAAGVLTASYFLWRWSEQPGWRYCLASAAAFAGAILLKFSALFFLAPVAVVYFAVAKRRGPVRAVAVRGLAFALLTALLLWGGYGFQSGILLPPGHRYVSRYATPENSLPNRLVRALGPRHLPAPHFFEGLIEVLSHNEAGSRAYLLGRHADRGWWYYFPAAVALKSALPLLLLAALGIAVRPRHAVGPLLAISVILGAALLSNLNIGVRHVLPVYPLLAILGGASVTAGRRPARVAALLLLGWQAAESVRAHPDYLAYFNQIARGREERFLLDSNLDWGQDLARLGRHLRDRGIQEVYLRYFGTAQPAKMGIRSKPLPPHQPVQGWIAISVNELAGLYNDPGEFRWLRERRPQARIGKSIWLYHVP